MLNSLEIRNYRNLKELKIESLKRINLITGRNNTGKSTLLEAISLYSSNADTSDIFVLLKERGEDYRNIRKNENNPNYSSESMIRSISSLFSNREIIFGQNGAIYIGIIEKTPNKKSYSEKSISLRFVKYIDKENIENDEVSFVREIIEDAEKSKNGNYPIGIEIKRGKNSRIYPLDDDRRRFRRFGDAIPPSANSNLQFIRTKYIDRENNGDLWDEIALTEKENYIIEALKIIESKTDKITFVSNPGNRERSAIIKLLGDDKVIPLKSMGDGINRILTIILALIESEGGFLLLDEFENGLHYSVQEKLWEMIFKLSGLLKVQVFATTHSNDCIKGFEKILNTNGNKELGKLIKLVEKDGKIMEIEYNAEELGIAADQNIETR